MNMIDSVEIRYFRSIYKLRLSSLGDLNVITGCNDCGKSNIIKALNLFFNGKTDFGMDHDFYTDFSFKRKYEATKESVKGKQFIDIKITFNRGERLGDSLPPKFTIAKRFDRYGSVGRIDSDVSRQMILLCAKEGRKYSGKNTASAINRFMRSIQFIYIPAVKDDNVFKYVLSLLQKGVIKESNKEILDPSIQEVNVKIQAFLDDLQENFRKVTGIDSVIEIPEGGRVLQELIDVETKYGGTGEKVSIHRRGDGIKAHYIPQILNYIAQKSKMKLIWGFEEPETSYEFRRCAQVANEFANVYSKLSQVFVTTHSPAYYGLKNENVKIIRVEKQGDITDKLEDADIRVIDRDLGISQLYAEYAEKAELLYQKAESLSEEMTVAYSEIMRLKKINEGNQCPVLFTEGKTDVAILKNAWKQLFQTDVPEYKIQEANTHAVGAGGEGDAGIGRLKSLIESVPAVDKERIYIALFDSDQPGIKKYGSLNKNFKESRVILDTGEEASFKRHKSGNAFAFCLPIPTSKQGYGDAKNFCIEYYFDEEYLSREKDGKKLTIEQDMINQCTANGIKLPSVPNQNRYFDRIGNGKAYFADEIVPDFPKEAFAHMEILFETIDKLIEAGKKQ